MTWPFYLNIDSTKLIPGRKKSIHWMYIGKWPSSIVGSMLLNWWLNFGPSLRKIPSWKISSECRWCYQRAVAHLFWMCFAIATFPNKMKRPEHVICILLMFCKLLKISTKCMQAKYIHVIQKNHHRIIHQFVFSVMMAREGHKVLYYHCHMERNYKNYLWGNEENFRCRFSYNPICR